MDLVTVENWGEEIFAEGVGVKWKNAPPPPTPLLHQTRAVSKADGLLIMLWVNWPIQSHVVDTIHP